MHRLAGLGLGSNDQGQNVYGACILSEHWSEDIRMRLMPACIGHSRFVGHYNVAV